MLKDLGLNWTIIGHSERRSIFGESLDIVSKKVEKAQEHDLQTIFCIGEHLE
jgi:triosephosphate isomerase